MFITGCHRSGTSIVSATIRNALKTDLICHNEFSEQVGSNVENLDGFYESAKLVEENNRLLAVINRRWDKPALESINWKSASLFNILIGKRECFKPYQSEPWVDKDPRLCLVWAAYKHILLREPYGILVIRNPLEVIQSLQLRNGFGIEKSAILWYLYNYHIAKECEADSMHIVDYNDLAENPALVVEGIASFMQRKDIVLSMRTEDLKGELYKSINTIYKKKYKRSVGIKGDESRIASEMLMLWNEWQDSTRTLDSFKKIFRDIPGVVTDRYSEHISIESSEGPEISKEYAYRCIDNQNNGFGDIKQRVEKADLQLKELQTRLEERTKEIKALEARINCMMMSASWRITSPIRIMGRFMNHMKVFRNKG